MVLEELVERKGNVSDLLGLTPNTEGLVDLSSANWSTASIVLRGLAFEKVRTAGTEILPNLVECTIRDSRFLNVSASQGHFWGAEDLWQRCVFRRVEMTDVISPQDRFEGCAFEDTTLIGWAPLDTVFLDCSFKNLTLEGMHALDRRRHSNRPRELEDTGAWLLFQNCRFERPLFNKCYFQNVGFQNCEVTESTVIACNFSGIISDTKWWKPEAEAGDPFVRTLDEILEMIAQKLGRTSRAYSVLD